MPPNKAPRTLSHEAFMAECAAQVATLERLSAKIREGTLRILEENAAYRREADWDDWEISDEHWEDFVGDHPELTADA